MKLPALPTRVRTLLLSEAVWRVLPTPATLYLNKERVRDPLQPPTVPKAEWSRRERHGLLAASEERLRNLEGKGPGLATVSAVIVAANLLAITGGWDQSTLLARVILVSAAAYGAMSLLMPLYLVGPLPRHTVHLAEVETAAAADEPEEALADSAAEAAMHNDLRNQRLANLLDAARRELSYALVLVILWVFLVPVTELLRQETAAPSPDHSAASARTTAVPRPGVESAPPQGRTSTRRVAGDSLESAGSDYLGSLARQVTDSVTGTFPQGSAPVLRDSEREATVASACHERDGPGRQPGSGIRRPRRTQSPPHRR